VDRSNLHTNWRDKAQGIHLPLSKLIYINKEEFKLLRSLRFCFLKGIRRFFRKEAKSEKYGEKSSNKSNIKRDLDQGNGKIYPSYEATKIEDTRNSLLWSWRRVRAFYREMQEIYDNKDLQKLAYELKYS